MTTLLVASGGGHLKQLHDLLHRFEVSDDPIWVTFDTGLSRSLLVDQRVEFVPYCKPHDVVGSARAMRDAIKLFRANRDIDKVISTGANLAVSYLPFAPMFGAKAIYVETATRTNELSLTGKIVDRMPKIKRYCQSPLLANKRWEYAGSVFDGFRSRYEPLSRPIRSLVVTVGSNDTYGFDRLLQHLVSIIPSGCEVLWQVGNTDLSIPGARPSASLGELEDAMRNADAVIAHSGTGSALTALQCGKYPMLAIRRAARGEHVDDHQELTAKRLQVSNLALPVEADEITWDDVVAAANWKVSFDPSHLPPLG